MKWYNNIPTSVPNICYNVRCFSIMQHPLYDYFITTTKKYLDYHFPEKNYYTEFEKRFTALLEENQHLSPLEWQHIISPLFLISVYDALQPELLNDLLLFKKHVIDGLYNQIMKPYITQQQSRMKQQQHPWDTFRADVRKGNQSLYDNDLFKLEMVEDSNTSFIFKLHGCFYNDTFKRYGYTHISSVMCEYDTLIHQIYESWVNFKRDSAIASDGVFCDFSYFLKK